MKRAVKILGLYVAQVSLVAAFVSFQTLPPLPPIQNPRQRHATTTMMKPQPSTANNRRRFLLATSGLGSIFFGGGGNRNEANAAAGYKSKGATNEVIRIVDGIRHKRFGGSDIVVSELGLGTQRWVSADFNAPSRDDCFMFMDQAILKSGVNLIDTAERYPIPSGEAGGRRRFGAIDWRLDEGSQCCTSATASLSACLHGYVFGSDNGEYWY